MAEPERQDKKPTSPLTHEQRLDIAARILLAGAERVLAEREAQAKSGSEQKPTPH